MCICIYIYIYIHIYIYSVINHRYIYIYNIVYLSLNFCLVGFLVFLMKDDITFGNGGHFGFNLRNMGGVGLARCVNSRKSCAQVWCFLKVRDTIKIIQN